MELEEKRKFKMPNTIVLIIGLIILAALATYLIPAGEYDLVFDETTGRDVIDPASYGQVEQTPVSISFILKTLYKGMLNGSGTIMMILLVGGLVTIITSTGSINRLLDRTLEKTGTNISVIIPIIMTLMWSLGFLGVIADQVVVFIPIGLILAQKMKLDPIATMGIIFLPPYIGFGTSPLCPYTTLIAQGIADVPLFTSAGFTTLISVIILIISIIYVTRYCKKVNSSIDSSLLNQDEIQWDAASELEDDADNIEFSYKDIIVVLSLFGGILTFAFGAYNWGWYLEELSACMVVAVIISAIVMKINVNDMATIFVDGVKMMVFSAILVGFASGISLVLTEGNIIHSIIYYLTLPLLKLSSSISAIFMFLINSIFNLFVPSGSGQATVVMPLMAPMADILGLTRQVSVLAYKYGDGLSNMIFPTSAGLMASLALAKVPYNKWLKFILPLFAIISTVAAIAIVIAVNIGIG